MKPSAWLEYQQLEQISPDTQIRLGKLSFWFKLKKFWQVLLEHLIEPSDLQVWHHFDDNESIWWNAYDPKTKRSITRVSEEEIRAWIEGRD